jgi:hypothetical protein
LCVDKACNFKNVGALEGEREIPTHKCVCRPTCSSHIIKMFRLVTYHEDFPLVASLLTESWKNHDNERFTDMQLGTLLF